MSRTFVIEEHCTYTVEVPDDFGMTPAEEQLLADEAVLDVDDPEEWDRARAEAFFRSRGAAAFPVEVDQREVYPLEVEGVPTAGGGAGTVRVTSAGSDHARLHDHGDVD